MLGAVVSPDRPARRDDDRAAARSATARVAIIEGESLVNDGTALVLFKFAVAAVVTGSFSLLDAAGSLVWSVLGGIGVGLVVGYVIRLVRRRVFNPPLEVTIAFLTGYFAFLPASAIGASGVLAVVTAGVYMGWHTPELTTVETRLQGAGFWTIFNFVLNALLFGLVGLQLSRSSTSSTDLVAWSSSAMRRCSGPSSSADANRSTGPRSPTSRAGSRRAFASAIPLRRGSSSRSSRGPG